MARAKTKKVEETENIKERPKTRRRSVANIRTNIPPAPGTGEPECFDEGNQFNGECPECGECREMGPLVREFCTYDGFWYNFTYGGCKEFCGNTEEKFSVVLKTNVMPIHVGDYQCVCVKKPILTGNDNSDYVWIDIDIGTNGFPMGSFDEYVLKGLRKIRGCETNTSETIDTLFANYLHELEALDMGIYLRVGEIDPLVRINEVVKNYYPNLENPNERYREKLNNNQEARYIASIRLANTPDVLDNAFITAVGMEFIRQLMSAVNTAISLFDSSAIFIPDIYDIFRRNIRHEISNGYYPDGFFEVVNFVRNAVGDCDCCDEGVMSDGDFSPEENM